eukprot:CAMPEP_0197515572 /NCGR_PEP_ID=MMETSP1318-20131121/660_1 /TAXON_ID=552666 /ORGANISM="Partenskyella glossopodia, Strain RCC365" /LENGTH=580 /DNA_ID=CAMNT_0043063983 /DNA_START=254 /DNA_END=1996 /DNA_ORIENTATION=-
MEPCPDTITVNFLNTPDGDLIEGESYDFDFDVRIEPGTYDIIPQYIEDRGKFEISHANVHSCVQSRGSCTPFVANTPGLATHSTAEASNLTTDGYAKFSAFVKLQRTSPSLSQEPYVIIAHIRFTVAEVQSGMALRTFDGCDNCTTTFDVAIGTRRTVVPNEGDISSIAYVVAGTAAAVVLVVVISIIWAVKKRKLNFESCLSAIFNEIVVIVCGILLDISSMAIFTVSFITVILAEPELIDLVPISVLIMIVGWVTTLFTVTKDCGHLWVLYLKHRNKTHFRNKVSAKFVRSRMAKDFSGMVASPRPPRNLNGNGGGVLRTESGRRQGNENMSAADIKEITNAITGNQEVGGDEKLLHLFEESARKWDKLTLNVLSLVLQAIPITVIQLYVLWFVSDTRLVTIFSFLLSALGIGIMVSKIGNFTTYKRELKEVAERINRRVISNIGSSPQSVMEVSSQANSNLPSMRATSAKRRSVSGFSPSIMSPSNSEHPSSVALNQVTLTPPSQRRSIQQHSRVSSRANILSNSSINRSISSNFSMPKIIEINEEEHDSEKDVDLRRKEDNVCDLENVDKKSLKIM